MKRVRRAAGFTLIEVIVAMVIIAAAAVTILGLMSSIATRSATSMEMTQATSIANSYLRRVLAPRRGPGSEVPPRHR